jgi:hypothetical protein
VLYPGQQNKYGEYKGEWAGLGGCFMRRGYVPAAPVPRVDGGYDVRNTGLFAVARWHSHLELEQRQAPAAYILHIPN